MNYKVLHTMLSTMKPGTDGANPEDYLRAGDIAEEKVFGESLERYLKLNAIAPHHDPSDTVIVALDDTVKAAKPGK